MKEHSRVSGRRALVRVGAWAPLVVLTLALMLSSVVASEGPNFDQSFKFGPPFASTGRIVRYRIFAKNTGLPVEDVVLSDVVPLGASYVPGSCVYRRVPGRFQPCNPSLDHLWEEDFDTGDVIVTRLAMRITAGTMKWPVRNCAYLTWDGHEKEMCFTTLVVRPRCFIPFIVQ